MINASEGQLWSGLTHLETSFRAGELGEEGGGGRWEVAGCFYITCQINKSEQRAFTGVEWGGGGER